LSFFGQDSSLLGVTKIELELEPGLVRRIKREVKRDRKAISQASFIKAAVARTIRERETARQAEEDERSYREHPDGPPDPMEFAHWPGFRPPPPRPSGVAHFPGEGCAWV
jgi:hypothetical protein